MEQEKNEIQIHPQANTPSVFSSIKALKDAQTIAKPLIDSGIVPQAYQNNMANALVALDISQRLGAPPLVIMQNLDIINGKPSFSGKFLIAALKSMPRFKDVRPVYFGQKGTDGRGCRYEAIDGRTGEIIQGADVTIKMAKAEGWYGKKVSKWPNMPELMLAYRAGAFFSRIYAPEITMGLPTAEESIDAPTTEDIAHEEVSEVNQNMRVKTEPTPKPPQETPTESNQQGAAGYSFDDDDEIVED
jgi:hypothetical protein